MLHISPPFARLRRLRVIVTGIDGVRARRMRGIILRSAVLFEFPHFICLCRHLPRPARHWLAFLAMNIGINFVADTVRR